MTHRFADSLRAGSGWNWFGSAKPGSGQNWIGSAEPNQFHPDPVRKLSANLSDIYHCCVYTEKLLMMDRRTVQNM